MPPETTPPAPEESVNTNAGFEAAMARKGIEREEGDTGGGDTNIASGLTYARDDQERFAPREEEPPPAAEGEEPDPLADYIASQHGGDAEAALAALYRENVNQASVIGRQGQELGDVRAMREEIAELRGALTATQAMTNQPVWPGDPDDVASSLVEQMGYRDAATAAANMVVEAGDDSVYSRIIDAWTLEQPYQAAKHVADFTAWQRDEAAAAEAPAQGSDAWVEEQKGIAAIQGPLERLSREMGEERWALVAPQMEAALDALPQAVAEMVVNSDPEVSHQGLQIVGERAYMMGIASQQQTQSRQQAKLAGSSVASSNLRPPSVSSSGEVTPDEIEAAKQRFRERIMAEETTDVRSGLTFGTPMGQAAQPTR